MSDSAIEEGPVIYTAEEQHGIMARVRHLHTTGEPGKAIKLKKRFLAGEQIWPSEYTDGIVPEKDVADPALIEPPPRAGPGSTKDAWAAWGMVVMDIDEKVFETLSRTDIITMAEERGVLPKG